MGVSGLMGIMMGRLTDRYNTRLVIAIGMVVGTASLVLLSTVDSLWQFYLYYGLGSGVYAGSTYAPVSATVSKWFTDKRTFALGIALMGIIIGQMVLSPVTARVISTGGWRTAYLVLAVVAFACAIPAVVLTKRAPGSGAPDRGRPAANSATNPAAQPQTGMGVREAAKTGPFWMLLVTGLVIGFGFYLFASHIVPYATDVGLSTTAAALILTLSSIGGIGGTLLAWWITVKLGNRYALLVLIALEALAMFLFIATRSVWSFYVVAILLGFSFSAASPVRMGMAAPLFGLRSIGSILGCATLAFSTGAIVGPFLAGYIFDSRQSYSLAFLVGGILLLIGALSAYLFGSHQRPR
jgi:MFS family permease